MLDKRELYCIACEPGTYRLSLEYMVEQACAGGAQIIQFRFQGIITDAIIKTARNLKSICKKRDVIFVINNFPELARDIDADGVHIGQNDMLVSQARHIVGSDKLIGLSTHSYEQALKAELLGADYIGFGPVYATPTKPDYTPVGLTDINTVVSKVSIPVFVIGGITVENVGTVINAGAERVAVVRAVFAAENPGIDAHALRKQIESAKKEKIYQEV